jgi:protein-S-isoprenylcysteine O-methyltransferase Ste14
MANDEKTGHGAWVVPIPPPLYYAVALTGGMLLHAATPLPVGARPITTIGGILLIACGLALALAGVAAVIRHRTTIVPHRPVSSLITTGPYRWSRNPMYAGLAIAYPGAALTLGSYWPLLLWPVVLLLVGLLVIRPEERYLTRRFGPAYLEYQTNVRRWL